MILLGDVFAERTDVPCKAFFKGRPNPKQSILHALLEREMGCQNKPRFILLTRACGAGDGCLRLPNSESGPLHGSCLVQAGVYVEQTTGVELSNESDVQRYYGVFALETGLGRQLLHAVASKRSHYFHRFVAMVLVVAGSLRRAGGRASGQDHEA